MATKKEKTKSVVVSTNRDELALVLPALFNNVDFEGLNGAITVLADHQGNLNDDEKKFGREIIVDWQKNVLQAIQLRAENMYTVLEYFGVKHNGRVPYGAVQSNFGPHIEIALAETTHTTELYQAYIAAEEARDAYKNDAPEAPVYDLMTTAASKLESKAAFDLAIAKYDIELTKLNRMANIAYKTWKNALLKDPEIQTMLRQAQSHGQQVTKLQTECKAKAQMAAVSISIGDAKIREALKEMARFTSTI